MNKSKFLYLLFLILLTILKGLIIFIFRIIVSNCLFIPLEGERFNGNDFIENAFENGAVASLVSEKYSSENISGPLIEVDDTLRAMQNLAKSTVQKMPPCLAKLNSLVFAQ